ncbi:Transcriptional regulator LsrR [bacterium HR17]|uniref:Transcriptional regulator LsrR n=1 Tax=Candidatus Fervidibacter japonicus TaxID=2035412 RepID=A0A2H5XB80_9BACT|nr:Transcriptional regulator LsrR [bacterium HR17]
MATKAGRPNRTTTPLRAAPLSGRELYRVLRVCYEPAPRRPREVLQRLKAMLPYRDWSQRRLRRLLERALKDPRADGLLSITITPPNNERLAAALRDALPELREAIVIPSLSAIDPHAVSTYLGVAAAQTYAPRFRNGQGVGFSGGRSVGAMAQALWLPPALRPLRLYALTRCPPTVLGFTAEGIVSEIVAKNLWRSEHWENPPERFLEGYLNPQHLRPEHLDWAFVGVGTLEEGELLTDFAEALRFDVIAAKRAGVVAELLGHLFCADGLPPAQPLRPAALETVPLSLLRRMVRDGKSVIMLAGGAQKATALLALHRAQRAGGALFNGLVTDEECAQRLLHLCDQPIAEADAIWAHQCKRFWVAHLRFAASERCRTCKAMAQRLRLSERRVARLLDEAVHANGQRLAPLVWVQVKAPKPEPIAVLELESALMERLGLMEVRVVHPVRDEWAYPAIGAAAAQWLKERWQRVSVFSVGLGGGRAVRALLEALDLPFCLRHFPALQRLHLFALQARLRERVLWGGGHPDLLDAVIMRCFNTTEGGRVICHPFEGDAVAEGLDAVFVSVGAFEVGDREVLQESGVTMGEVAGAVGTLLSQPFDAAGQPLGRNLGERLRTLSLQRLRELVSHGVPVFALVRGAERAQAAASALRGGLFNGLVIDRIGAETLLNASG